jgi:hypothetical protein
MTTYHRNRYEQRLTRGHAQHGQAFNASDLEACHPSIRTAFVTGARVRVRTTYSNGEVYERTGTVSTTTGWRPAFILIHRSTDTGSSDVLGTADEVVAIKRGRTYTRNDESPSKAVRP